MQDDFMHEQVHERMSEQDCQVRESVCVCVCVCVCVLQGSTHK